MSFHELVSGNGNSTLTQCVILFNLRLGSNIIGYLMLQKTWYKCQLLSVSYISKIPTKRLCPNFQQLEIHVCPIPKVKKSVMVFSGAVVYTPKPFSGCPPPPPISVWQSCILINLKLEAWSESAMVLLNLQHNIKLTSFKTYLLSLRPFYKQNVKIEF